MYEPIDMTGPCIRDFAKAEGMDEESVRELFLKSGLYDIIKECYITFSHADERKSLEICRAYLQRKNITY